MSSAILYVAIVAIWACVLIPRWLRRDPALGPVAADGVAVPDEPGLPDSADADRLAVNPDLDDSAESLAPPGDDGDSHHPAPQPMTVDESRRRMRAARRRLLIMLAVLEAAAVALVLLGLAAAWVVAPPSVMFAGYLLLLREAAHADAERAQREADARARARAGERARLRAARRAEAAAGASAGTASAAGADLAAAPVPADYEAFGPPGRDFAPGLAGKYTPSYPDPGQTDDYDYDSDSHDEPRLRAVGD